MAHVLVVVAQKYNANELWPVLKELKAGSHSWDTAAYEDVIIDERSYKGYRASRLLKDIDSVDGYDAVVFVSGNPKDTMAHWKDPHCKELVRQAVERELPLAGICASVPSLGPAIKGVRVSAFPLSTVREEIIMAGGLLQEISLETDGNIATAENEAMAGMWARNFRCLIERKPVEFRLQPSPFKRDTRKLKPIPEVEFLRKENEGDISSK